MLHNSFLQLSYAAMQKCMQKPVRYLAPLVEVAAHHGLRDRSGDAAYIYARALALCRRRVLLAAAAAATIVRV